MLTENDIHRIIDYIVRGCSPVAAGIFGSYATGIAGADSDLDVFVIRHTHGSAASRNVAIRRYLFGLMSPMDFAVFTPAEFAEGLRDPHSFISTVAAQARVYYWSREAEDCLPSLRAKLVERKGSFGAAAGS